MKIVRTHVHEPRTNIVVIMLMERTWLALTIIAHVDHVTEMLNEFLGKNCFELWYFSLERYTLIDAKMFFFFWNFTSMEKIFLEDLDSYYLFAIRS